MITWPGLMCPGHQAIVGSLVPPSNVVSFPHKNGPLDPPDSTTALHNVEVNLNTLSVFFKNCGMAIYC